MCSFQFNGICFQRKQVWIDSFSMPGALHCTNVKNRSLLVLTILHSGFVGGTTEDVKTNFTCSKFWVCSASSMRVKTCVHRTAPSASWQPLCRKNILWNAWKCLRIHIFFSVLLFADTNRHELWLPRSFLPSCWMSPCVYARNRPQLDDCGENTAPEFLCSISLRISCRACCSNPRDKRTQDFKFLACRDGTCTSVTRVPADSKTSIPVTGPIFTRSLRIACNIEFREFLGPEYAQHWRVELFPSMTDSLVIWSCPISTFLANAACSEALWVSVSRFEMSFGIELRRTCDMFRSLCVNIVNSSGSRSVAMFLPIFFVWVPNLEYHSTGKYTCK